MCRGDYIPKPRAGYRGFAFSLDSFVAFSLILIAIQSLVAISSTPAGYYLSLQQASYLAQDTLNSAYATKTNEGGKTIIDGAVESALYGSAVPQSLVEFTSTKIPRPYTFSYDYYDFGTSQWHAIYNASNPSEAAYAIKYPQFVNRTFHRVCASSTVLVGVYSDPLLKGDSPYCNVMCKGYIPSEARDSTPQECTVNGQLKVPCDPYPSSTFDAGNFSTGLLRLTVCG